MRVKYLLGGAIEMKSKSMSLIDAIKTYKYYKHTLHLKGVKISLI